jgi:hypothetical protein
VADSGTVASAPARPSTAGSPASLAGPEEKRIKRLDFLAIEWHGHRKPAPPPVCVQRSAHRDAPFDDLARILASPLPRRKVLQLALVSLAGAALASLKIEPAWASTDCFCSGVPLQSGQACCSTASPPQPYDTASQCCTSAGVQQKCPIVNLIACPNRVPHPGYVPVPNGCGAADGPHVPDQWGSANFEPCCNAHDICYGTCLQNKATCDSNFLTCMQGSCDTVYPPGTGVAHAARNRACRGVAVVYYKAVSNLGQSAFDAAQREACDCCTGDQPCCPAGQIICNGVCCDPDQDCINGTCQSTVCTSSGTCSSGQAFPVCGGNCLSTGSIEGPPLCSSEFFCGDTPSCTSSTECQAQGYTYCQAPITGCCGQVCVPSWGTLSASPALVAPAGTKRNSGSS